MSRWTVLIRDHHEGYISWEEFARNQDLIADNAHMKKRTARRSGRGGRALLSGMVRCSRCGYMMRVFYGSKAGNAHRYVCRSAEITRPDKPCVAVGGVRVDRAVSALLLEALTPEAIEAAQEAAHRVVEQRSEVRGALERELEEARYEVRLASRRYEAVDPDKRLVAQQLEARWEDALQRVGALERRIEDCAAEEGHANVPTAEELTELARRLPEVWNSPSADMKLKQRIIRILIKEVLLDVDTDRSETVVTVHWAGGRHTEARVARNRAPARTPHQPNAVEVVGRMATRFSDLEIANTLNRARRGKRTTDTAWTELRVRKMREQLELPAFDPEQPREEVVSRDEAAHRLGICVGSVTRLIKRGVLPAEQPVAHAPWRIPASALKDPAVLTEVRAVEARRPMKLDKYREKQTLTLPGFD